MDQAELLGHLERLAARLPLPLFLYNMPSCVRTVFEPETVRAAADIPGILGLKDSSGNMAYFKKLLALLQDRPAFTLLTGPEELLAESVQAGGHGGVTGGANLFPSLYAGLYQAAAAGDRVRVNDLHARVMTISRNLYTVGTKSSSYLRGVKCALACLGICGDAMAEPFRPFSESKRQIIRERLEQATASLYPPL
jgi:4-hydroxy-tetrahydrodipicolinate synthase